MKKIHTFALHALLLSLIISPACNAISMSDTTQQILGTTGIICTTVLIGACWSHNNAQHTELEKTRLLIQTEERKKEDRKKQFHTIERIEELAAKFKELHDKNPRAEAHPDKVQEELLKKMLLLEGSVTKFEQTITHLTQACNELDPEIAQEHEKSVKMLSWIRQSMHTNAHVSKKKNAEREKRLAEEKENAAVRTIKLEEKIANDNAQTAEQHVINSKKCENLIATAMSNINKNRLELKTQIQESFKQFNQLSDKKYDIIVNLLESMTSANRSEHRKTRDEQYASEQRIKKELADIKETSDNNEQQLAYIAQELYSIKGLLLPTPSAPPAHTLPGQNPPAQNPDWVPGVPPHVPMN